MLPLLQYSDYPTWVSGTYRYCVEPTFRLRSFGLTLDLHGTSEYVDSLWHFPVWSPKNANGVNMDILCGFMQVQGNPERALRSSCASRIEGTLLLILLAAVWAPQCGCSKKSDSTSPSSTQPAASVAASAPSGSQPFERVKELGFVEPSSTHEVLFELPLIEGQPPRIDKVRSECECMSVPDLQSTTAGTASTMKVVFAAPKNTGPYAKRVILTTKSKAQPTVTLLLRANVGLPLEVVPATLNVGRVPQGKEANGSVVLKNAGAIAIRPLYATSSASGVTALIPRMSIPARGEGSIPIRVQGTEAPGTYVRQMAIQTDCPTQSSVNVSVSYEVVAGG
jgi:hypothetical protein